MWGKYGLYTTKGIFTKPSVTAKDVYIVVLQTDNSSSPHLNVLPHWSSLLNKRASKNPADSLLTTLQEAKDSVKVIKCEDH